MNKFWMIMREGDVCVFDEKYFAKENAENEVERLVKEEGRAFILLEAMEVCEPQEQPVIWKGLREKEVGE